MSNNNGFKSTKEWAQGAYGERVVRCWLEKTGHSVLPVGLIEDGGAPAFTQYLKKTVSPDLLAAKDGSCKWVEVKTKTRSPFYQVTREFRQGISLRHWEQYLEVERTTGFPGYLAIIVRDWNRLLFAPFKQIAIDAQQDLRTDTSHGEAMIFFRVNRFDWYDLDDDGETFSPILGRPPIGPAPARIEPKIRRPWEENLATPSGRQDMLPWSGKGDDN